MSHIKNNISAINQQIIQSCKTAKRSESSVTLLAVSKTKPAEAIKEAYLTGQKSFGENYVQEAVEKINQLTALLDLVWHFIGPIQSNKTKLIAENFAWVHSVDRIKIAKRLNEHRAHQDSVLNICLQVNISEESTKSGTSIESIHELAEYVSQCPKLALRGIMAIPEKNAPLSSYQKMNELFLSLQLKYPSVDTLSMGMSADMDQAITSGSTMVRVGSAIFGARE